METAAVAAMAAGLGNEKNFRFVKRMSSMKKEVRRLVLAGETAGCIVTYSCDVFCVLLTYYVFIVTYCVFY